MIGKRYGSVGITLTYDRKKWGGSLQFHDGGFAGDDDADSGIVSTEGELRSRYYVADGDHASALTVVIDVLKADADRLGIEWRDPHLYIKGDGEWEDYPPPDDWRLLLLQQSERIGWPPLYTDILTFQLTKEAPGE